MRQPAGGRASRDGEGSSRERERAGHDAVSWLHEGDAECRSAVPGARACRCLTEPMDCLAARPPCIPGKCGGQLRSGAVRCAQGATTLFCASLAGPHAFCLFGVVCLLPPASCFLLPRCQLLLPARGHAGNGPSNGLLDAGCWRLAKQRHASLRTLCTVASARARTPTMSLQSRPSRSSSQQPATSSQQPTATNRRRAASARATACPGWLRQHSASTLPRPPRQLVAE